MLIAANLLHAVATILNYVLEIYIWVVIIAAILSWFTISPYNPIVRFLRSVTDPVLNPIRRVIGRSLGPFDISPIIVILAIIFIQKFLIRSMIELADKLKRGGMI